MNAKDAKQKREVSSRFNLHETAAGLDIKYRIVRILLFNLRVLTKWLVRQG